MRIAVTGKHGQVVSALVERASTANSIILPIGRPEFDLVDRGSIRTSLLDIKPDIVVSAAAHTAVDKAESEEELAFSVNAYGPEILAKVCAELNIPIIHISTDYVFSGEKPTPYFETDETNPVSVYGRSKLAGEKLVAAQNPDHVILRTAWVYSPYGNNFLKTMLRLAETRDNLGVVSDQFGAPTSALDIADAILTIAERLVADRDEKYRGLFNLTGHGEASWADFAEEIFEHLKSKTGRSVSVKRITTSEYPTPARRPANSRLSGEKLSRVYGINLPDWKLSTKLVVERLLSEKTQS